MCWITAYKPEPITADKDINVQKLLKVDKEGHLHSLFFDKTWELNQLYESPIKRTGNKITDAFHSCHLLFKMDGFNDIPIWHSYTNLFMKELCYAEKNQKPFNAIIPKGATYYVNEYWEYASDKLIIIGEIPYK